MKKAILGTALLLAAIQFSSINIFAQSSTHDILGVWETEAKDGRIEIYPCEGKYCGKLLWGSEIVNEDGTSKKDVKNPDKTLRDRDLVGITNLTGLKYDDDVYKGGRIYNAANGKWYKCYVWLKEGRLYLRGYLGLKALGQTTTWNRIEG